MLTRLLPTVTGVFLMFGLSLLSAGTTGVLRGQLALGEGIPASAGQTLKVGNLAEGWKLHEAAPADLLAAEQAGRVLFIGILMILAALLLYTMHVVRLQREDREKTPWHRMQRWLQLHLDMRLPHLH